MAKPDKTALFNASVARSMKAWTKATIDLDRERQRKGPVQNPNGNACDEATKRALTDSSNANTAESALRRWTIRS